jgi:viroplasmin and RNaseH domain-containing protein
VRSSFPLSSLLNPLWRSEEADHQIKGCPGQEYRSKKSKSEALASYTHWFQEGKVEKWVELTDDALPRSSIT